MTRWILCAGILVAGTAGAEERTTGHETNSRIATARCSVSKRCWPERSKGPCDQAEKIRAQPGSEAPTGLFPSDLNQCLNAVEKADCSKDCSKIQIDLIRFMTSTENTACQGYRDYNQNSGRYALPKK